MAIADYKESLVLLEKKKEEEQLLRDLFMGHSSAGSSMLQSCMEQVLYDTPNFLRQYVGTGKEILGKSVGELSREYKDTLLRRYPEKDASEAIIDLINNIAPYAVNVASPYFVGHMTSAIPPFMIQLKAITAALNQNVVKLETSAVVSLIEKQVLAKIHRLIYRQNQEFYDYHVQNMNTTLGCFTQGGTEANVTALWAARNALLAPKDGFGGVEKEGIHAAYRVYGIDRCVILVSRMGHYSLRKASGILGIGNQNIIPIDVDENNRISIHRLTKKIDEIHSESSRNRVLAVVGIAGTTETGTVDPLDKIGEICHEHGIHFHVDAAWGGPVLLSQKYRFLLEGIEFADSVTIDGHKQFYMPMGSGMVYFKDPYIMDNVSYHANYIIRDGSGDLGIKSVSGSREANSLILHSALKILGTQGYGLLIEHGIETARQLEKEIMGRPDFHLVTQPELNILTYQIYPQHYDKILKNRPEKATNIYGNINEINRIIQREQREYGRGFVSMTMLRQGDAPDREIVVLRIVIANPMTNMDILMEVINEQETIYRSILPRYELNQF